MRLIDIIIFVLHFAFGMVMDFTKKEPRANPFVSANIFSKALFLWTIPLFRKGKKKDLTLDDLYDPLEDDLAGKLGDDLEQEWTKRMKAWKNGKNPPNLIGALFKILGKQYMLCSIGLIIGELIFRMSQPLILRELIKTFSETSETSKRDQYLLALALSASTLGNTLIYHPSAFYLYRVSMKCRLALSSLIYRKALRLSTCAAYQKTNVGAIVNLLSNDVNRFDQTLIWILFIPMGCVQIVLLSYFLWEEFGLSGLAGIGALLVLMPLQYFNGKLSGKYRLEIAERTDERGRIMNEIITGIRILKMYAWETPFSIVIHHLRKLEISALKKRLFVRGMYFCLYSAAPKFLAFLTFLAYLLEGNDDLTADKVFFTTSLYFTLSMIWVVNIPFAISGIGEIFVSLDRIRTFLQIEEKSETKNFITSEVNNDDDPRVDLQNISANWNNSVMTLSNFSMSISGDKVVCVIGSCGSGKSSLLHVLLGELPIIQGKCKIFGRVSYAAQEPWVFASTVRQNILFGRAFDREKYEKCVDAACLREDFKQLPNGDNTIVGERGVSLSGGQKARVSLARCLYEDVDIYLMDDILSAVDTKVSRHLFENSIGKGLQGKLRILVTHQLQYLPQADYIIVLKDGKVMSQGTYQELVDAKVDFVSLMVKEDGGDGGDDPNKKDDRSSSLVSTSSDIIEEMTNDFEDNRIEGKLKDEGQATGSVGFKMYLDYFKMGRSTFLLILTILIFILCQLTLSAVDYFLSFWTNAEVKNSQESYLILEDSASYLGRNTYIYIYSGLTCAAIVTSFFRSVLFLNYTTRIGINVHNAMFSSLVRAKIKFFDDNPSGRVMNRFTKDIGSMDELLPPTMLDMLTIFSQMVGVVVVIVISNYYMVPPAVIVLIFLWIARDYFVKTARDVKRIEGITKSPLFTHTAQTFTGLTTIRALKAEGILIGQFDQLQDIHTSPWFLFFSSARAFSVCCEFISTLFLTVISVSFLLMQDSTEVGNVGLAISAAMTLSGELQYGLRQSAEVENLMTSVERNLEYADLPSEAPLYSKPDKKPGKDWPLDGAIKFENVSLSYHDDGNDNIKDLLVLKHLTFEIKAREKIGIVGRTGAGKSSIIQALFRLTEPRPAGMITIDGVNIGEIGLHDLRKAISIIPQEPVLFSGTVRYNLDPFNEYSDDMLWAAISDVELKNAVPALDFKVSDGGSNFSVGQRQLVCLARAVLRKNKIILMDEATASVDPETDMLIQKTIREKFADCTILTIAHRLHSVIDSDKILVLDNGYLREFDSPKELLAKKDGVFRGMVEHLGKAGADALKEKAEQAYIQQMRE